MHKLKTLITCALFLSAVSAAHAKHDKLWRTRAFSPQYEDSRVLVVAAVIRPDAPVPFIMMMPIPPKLDLPENILIMPFRKYGKNMLCGKDQQGREWVVEQPKAHSLL